MHSEDSEYKKHSVIVNPNLGRPTFLRIDPKLKNNNFHTEILVISYISDLKEFEDKIKNEIKLYPVLDNTWKFRDILKKSKSEKKKSFWARFREKRIRNKKKEIVDKELRDRGKLIKFKIDDLDYKLKKLRAYPYRGDIIFPTITNVKEVPTTPIHDIFYIDNLTPQDYLLKYGVFGNLHKFYIVSIEFKVSKEVRNFLKERKFIMFDLELVGDRRNYHSIVISKQDWSNFKFIHATDLHLAERNDKIYSIIKKWTESSIKKNVDDFFDTAAKKLKLKKRIKSQEETLANVKIPLRKRLINPNNQFRKFIKLVNRKVFNNEIDFIVLTGDLVDFTVLSKFAKKVRKVNEFKYEESNWQIFKNIILNTKDQKQDKGVIKGEELLCPIFTTVGNHDYRPFHYDITWAEMYKKIGLNAAEAVALNELFSASPITALMKSTMALKGYLSEINSSFDFSITFGENEFIFLNTGSDSFKNLRDLITGHPSVTGLSTRQIRYLENLINHKIKEKSKTFLFLHGPPINTGENKLSIKLFEKKGGRFIKEKLEDFRESLLAKLGQTKSDARLDKVFNVKYGSISSNWEKLVKFCKDYCFLTFTGHTHTQREFRLEDPETKTMVFDAPPFNLKKIENPAAIYYDTYSELYADAESVEKHAPFVVQTPALGLGGYKNPENAGGYREVVFKDGKLSSFKVKFINR
ncbi:MAG: metallophosphoesterase [Candidatus Heimdallarchaeota archaeon]